MFDGQSARLLVSIVCFDLDILRNRCRRRGGDERIRKDLFVPTPTHKLLSGRRRIGGHCDRFAHFIVSAPEAVFDRQFPGCFRATSTKVVCLGEVERAES